MSKEMIPELPFNGDTIFKVGAGCVVIIIIYFIYNLFSKMKEINNKMDSFLAETPHSPEISELPKDVMEEMYEDNENKASNIDLTGVDPVQDLATIEE